MNIAQLGRCLFPVVVLAVGCSGSDNIPSERTARSVFENKMAKEIKTGALVLNSFTKTNGKHVNILGTDGYAVEFKVDVSYPKGVMPECTVEAWAEQLHSHCLSARISDVQPKSVGQRETVVGNMLFEKTEKGWKGEDGKLYQ